MGDDLFEDVRHAAVGCANDLLKSSRAVQFFKGLTAVEGGACFRQGRLEIASFGGDGTGGVEQNRIAAGTVEFAAEQVAHHHRSFIGRAAAQIRHRGSGQDPVRLGQDHRF